jgi:uncharacterized protein YaiE (UPF0345 family)
VVIDPLTSPVGIYQGSATNCSENRVATFGRIAMTFRMSENFENVSIVKKANVYFGGQVTSRTVIFADGSKKTLGFMQAGDYEFGTEAAELMEMLGGEMDVKLDGSDEWNTYGEGTSFNVPANSKFSLKVKEGGADYCCTYLS